MWSALFNKLGLSFMKWAVSSLIQWAKEQFYKHQEDKKLDEQVSVIQKLSEEIKKLKSEPVSEKRDNEIHILEIKLRAALKRQHSDFI